ncbi:MAG: threonine/serine dehydratase [Candidatus Latescibacteria bacterium]|nr:threonine/serine dehydratase [Candidatus Latescibacterota bacterium]NIO56295.1 threonine/serine dehydratase [Candidatus Latescibacterota bacterium]
MDVRKEVLLAENRIRPYIRQTFLEYSPYFSQLGGANVYCKLENLQHTGAFKVRGAMNKLLSLTEEQRARGVVTASTGNHGAAVAWSLGKLNASGIIFVPEDAVPSKVQIIERLGGEVRYFEKDAAKTEVYARQYADRNQLVYVSPYNDPQVIGGQGTIGIELEQELQQINVVFVSLGGGGLISGVAGYLKTTNPGVHIIGCSPENSQVMIQSVKAGKILDLPSLPTLSDGTAGGIEAGAITFDLCRKLVDEYMTVTESEIKESLRMFIQTHRMLIEGAAAVAVASFLKMAERFADKNVVLIICGANISAETLKTVL